jgi:uncharacterized membrane protein YeaQ/YmgE (transglycosylase-associated protein family)
MNAGVGLVGAWLGTWFAGEFRLPPFVVAPVGGVDFPIVWSILGSAALVGAASALR